jgi:hypothetical protein
MGMRFVNPSPLLGSSQKQKRTGFDLGTLGLRKPKNLSPNQPWITDSSLQALS